MTLPDSIDEHGRERIVRLVIKANPPDRLSAIVGDFVHNLRSSLDRVMLAACEAGGLLTPKQESDSQFPITSTPSEFDRLSWRIDPAPADVKALVRQMQPWYWIVQGSSPPVDDQALSAEVRHESLSTVRDLSNIDKHRRIHLTSWYPKDLYIGTPTTIEVFWRNATPAERAQGQIGRWTLVGDDAEVVRLESNGEAGLTLQRYVDLGWPDVELGSVLQGLLQHVEWAVGVLAVRIGRR